MFRQERKLCVPIFGGILFGLMTVVTVTPGYAEDLPAKGTFRGVYRVNRAGVGRFDIFVISSELKTRMAPYEGKYIELEIVKGTQPTAADFVIVYQIGKVTKLPDPPLKLKVDAIHSAAKSPEKINVVYSMNNVGKNDITVDANHLNLRVLSLTQARPNDASDNFYRSGYTHEQLNFHGLVVQPWNFISPMQPGKSTHYYTRQILLRPGESAPFVLHDLELEPGRYELTVAGTYYPSPKEIIPVIASQSFDFPMLKPNEIPAPLLDSAAVEVVNDDEWFVVTGRLIRNSESKASLFAKSYRDHYQVPGLIQLYSETEALVPAILREEYPDSSWRRIEIDDEGLPFEFRVRQADLFSRTRVAKIVFWTVTEAGIERLTLADNLPERVQQPLPPWGEEVRGCRLRIQLAREIYKSEEQIRFFYQVKSNGEFADVYSAGQGNVQSHIVVTIDGKKARLRSHSGVGDGINEFPIQGEIKLKSGDILTSGKHSLQFSLRGVPGIFTNTRGEEFRKFDATMVSNVVDFDVLPE
ncbi:MAG: hypothetical protein WEB58_12930 [Planctomycetaceae bacterium]